MRFIRNGQVSTLVSLFQSALDALRKSVSQELQQQQTTLGFHVKPGTRPFREILIQLVNPKALGGENAAMFGYQFITMIICL